MCKMGAMCNFYFVPRRKGLKAALAGREGKSLSAILRFLIKYIGDYRFTRTLIDVANMLLGELCVCVNANIVYFIINSAEKRNYFSCFLTCFVDGAGSLHP